MQCSEIGPTAISHFTVVIDWMHGLGRTNVVKFQRVKISIICYFALLKDFIKKKN